MVAGLRASLGRLAVVFGVSLAAMGCDAGGLLVVEGNPPKTEPTQKGHSSAEIVNGGTVAKNGKYKMMYVLGQPSPQQGVATGAAGQRLNGGLVGAVQSD